MPVNAATAAGVRETASDTRAPQMKETQIIHQTPIMMLVVVQAVDELAVEAIVMQLEEVQQLDQVVHH